MFLFVILYNKLTKLVFFYSTVHLTPSPLDSALVCGLFSNSILPVCVPLSGTLSRNWELCDKLGTVISYVAALSEKLRRIFNKHSITLYVKPGITLIILF